MSKITRQLGLLSSLTFMAFAAPLAQAQCAVCTLAIVGGLGISRFLGVDDMYVGVWLGAAIFALAGFLGTAVGKKWPQFKPGKWLAQVLVILIFTIVLYFADGYVYKTSFVCITAPCPSIASYRLSNLAQGMVIGIICLYLGLYLDKALRRLKNDCGRPYFPFQKAVCPVALVILGTLVVWFLLG